MPPGAVFGMYKGEKPGTCWDILAHWKDLQIAAAVQVLHGAASTGLSLQFSHFGDAHISCSGNVTVQVDIECDPKAEEPVAQGAQGQGCNWQFQIKTAAHSICHPQHTDTFGDTRLSASADAIVAAAARQSTRTLAQLKAGAYPSQTHVASAVPQGGVNNWTTTAAGGWVAGFFPGLLWKLYNQTQDQMWMDQALEWTEGMRSQQYDTQHHDVGFKVFDSFGQGLRNTEGNTKAQSELHSRGYSDVIVTAAHSLATRFNPHVGCTQSWAAGHHCRADPDYYTAFPVIIDNMMNLELLFWAAKHSDNQTLHQMAESHANMTALNHVRADGSTFHVVDYNSSTGHVNKRCTSQGLNDMSTWARGQAWCIYGFTMSYRYTKLEHHLDTAIRCAQFWLAHTSVQGAPADGIPLWDFSWKTPQSAGFRDSSAAAIAASAFLELSTVASSGTKYKSAAQQLISALAAGYLGDYEQTEGILVHAAGANPAWSPDNFDVSLVYGGYFVLEAVQRLAGV